jgi:hypothetical protein
VAIVEGEGERIVREGVAGSMIVSRAKTGFYTREIKEKQNVNINGGD